MIAELTHRTRDIFRRIVDLHLQTGLPVASSAVAEMPGVSLSSASIRNIMHDLEKLGLLYAPHVSAGRLPTEGGLRHYVHGVLEIGNITADEQKNIDSQCHASGKSFAQMLADVTAALSGLTRCAGIVAVPKDDQNLKHIEFVALSPGRALVVLVFENGHLENRLIDVPLGLPQSALVEAGNFMAHHLIGRNIADARASLRAEILALKTELDDLTARVVDAGLASYMDAGGGGDPVLILRGGANLLDSITAAADLERVRHLLSVLESREAYDRLFEAAEKGGGIQIFIGSDNELFARAGCSMITAPFRDGQKKVIGTLGVIGPTRMNYGRIIPMVDYTAKLMANMMQQNQNNEVVHG